MARAAERVGSLEPSKRFQDLALTQPVIVSKNGRDRKVMISIEEYQRLKRRALQALAAWEFSEQLEAIRRAEPPPEAAAFDHELKL
jgi:hypothetical protein